MFIKFIFVKIILLIHYNIKFFEIRREKMKMRNTLKSTKRPLGQRSFFSFSYKKIIKIYSLKKKSFNDVV